MSTSKIINVALVDDHKIILDGISSILSDEENINIIGVCNNALELINMLYKKKADIILADINMPGMTGIEMTEKIRKTFPEVKVIALSMHNEPSLISKMIKAGAKGYVLKSSDGEELIKAINDVATGETFLSSDVKDIISKSVFHADDHLGRLSKDIVRLTPRESEVLSLIAKEHTNVEIANKLFISERTVETHRKNIFTKTKTKSLVGLIKYAMENKLIK